MNSVKLKALSIAFVIGTAFVSASAQAEPLQEEVQAPTPQQLAAVELAIIEALLLKDQCGGRPQDCERQPPCDAQGRRPNGNNCTLVWKTEEGRPEQLTWVEDWEVKVSVRSHIFRLPTIGHDGKLY